MKKTRFSQKRSNLELWCLLTTYRKLCKEPITGSLKSKMAEIRHLENRHDVIFFCRGWSDLDKISETGAEWHVDCGGVVEIETRCRIPIWRTFDRIQWHVIPEPPATLQGAVTWRNQCHDCAILQGVRIPSAILNIVFRHILFVLFLMQFRLWRAAAFVSSPIHLLLIEAVKRADLIDEPVSFSFKDEKLFSRRQSTLQTERPERRSCVHTVATFIFVIMLTNIDQFNIKSWSSTIKSCSLTIRSLFSLLTCCVGCATQQPESATT